MIYYRFNVVEYATSTAHLSNSEDLAYRRLLDLYFSSEQPIPLETQSVARRLRVGHQDLKTVLSDFFQETENGYVHEKCEHQIAQYLNRAQANKINGLKGGRKPNGLPVATESQAKRKAININNKNINNKKSPYMTKSDTDSVPYEDISNLYNEICVPKGRPEAKVLSDKRRKAIKALWNSSPHAQNIEWWREYFTSAMAIPYMASGFTGSDGRTWKGADLDYLLQERTVIKVVEYVP